MASGCGGGGTEPSAAAPPLDAAVAADLTAFPVEALVVGEREWTVAVASTPELRVQGLRGVADLGDLDGMLFVFDAPTTSAFTMLGTLMPIDIAFFDSDGVLVDRLQMVPCAPPGPCPSYRSSAPFRFALETEAGGFDGVELRLGIPAPGGG